MPCERPTDNHQSSLPWWAHTSWLEGGVGDQWEAGHLHERGPQQGLIASHQCQSGNLTNGTDSDAPSTILQNHRRVSSLTTADWRPANVAVTPPSAESTQLCPGQASSDVEAWEERLVPDTRTQTTEQVAYCHDAAQPTSASPFRQRQTQPTANPPRVVESPHLTLESLHLGSSSSPVPATADLVSANTRECRGQPESWRARRRSAPAADDGNQADFETWEVLEPTPTDVLEASCHADQVCWGGGGLRLRRYAALKQALAARRHKKPASQPPTLRRLRSAVGVRIAAVGQRMVVTGQRLAATTTRDQPEQLRSSEGGAEPLRGTVTSLQTPPTYQQGVLRAGQTPQSQTNTASDACAEEPQGQTEHRGPALPEGAVSQLSEVTDVMYKSSDHQRSAAVLAGQLLSAGSTRRQESRLVRTLPGRSSRACTSGPADDISVTALLSPEHGLPLFESVSCDNLHTATTPPPAAGRQTNHDDPPPPYSLVVGDWQPEHTSSSRSQQLVVTSGTSKPGEESCPQPVIETGPPPQRFTGTHTGPRPTVREQALWRLPGGAQR